MDTAAQKRPKGQRPLNVTVQPCCAPHGRDWFGVPQPILIRLALFSVPMATAICCIPTII